jgi:hypothetical protein
MQPVTRRNSNIRNSNITKTTTAPSLDDIQVKMQQDKTRKLQQLWSSLHATLNALPNDISAEALHENIKNTIASIDRAYPNVFLTDAEVEEYFVSAERKEATASAAKTSATTTSSQLSTIQY